MQNPDAQHRTCIASRYTQLDEKNATRNTKTSTLTVTLLEKIEIIKRIVAVITVVPKEASVPIGFNC